MKVKELIALLQQKDPNATVIIMTAGGYQEPYVDISPALRELPVDGSVVLQPEG